MESEYECDICKNTFKSIYILQKHKKNAKYCKKLQNSICKYCNLTIIKDESNEHNLKCLELQYEILKNENIILKTQNKELQDKLNDITIKLINKSNNITNNYNNSIEIQDIYDDFIDYCNIAESNASFGGNQNYITETENNQDSLEDCNISENIVNNPPLDLGNDFYIEHRNDDGYIDITNLCKAGKKEFKDWNRLQKSKAYLKVLSVEVNIPTSDLVKVGTGSKNKETKHTWVHPYVAINIAQWISPVFDVKVSSWVYEIMITGKVDISKTKSYLELQKENKDKDLRITYLEKKYIKKHPRLEIKERNVIYIISTRLLMSERRYIMGKAHDLTSRLSTYNKSDEHEIIYYKECKDEESMGIVENMVFYKLREYRESANRERFILPEEKEIKFFKEIIDECVKQIGLGYSGAELPSG